MAGWTCCAGRRECLTDGAERTGLRFYWLPITFCLTASVESPND
jgi:hypothetical protein